ncbi:MAG TPA: polysaccharide biosynthesis/export family protein [Terriglobales bacterium]|nr:polysaccharide biosynthesis/export family protein [Terriglobales bacterium]
MRVFGRTAVVVLTSIITVIAQNPAAKESNDAARPAGTDAAIAVQGVQPAETKDSKVSDYDRSALKVGVGDLLEMKVFGVPDLTDQVRIGADGNISLPLVGSVRVEGLSIDQAQKTIETKLRDGGFVRDPHVTISVKEFVTQGISVMGEVVRPGVYPLLGARRLFDALSSAGGTTQKAGKVVSITRRDKPNEPILVALSSDPQVAAKTNVDVFPGDTIVVSKAGIVYVVGEVGRPSGFVMENNESLTVLQALALAGGLGKNAALNDCKIIRKTSDGRQEVPIAMKKILEAKAGFPDVPMQAEDILFVPASAGKSAARRTMEAIIQISTGVAIRQ